MKITLKISEELQRKLMCHYPSHLPVSNSCSIAWKTTVKILANTGQKYSAQIRFKKLADIHRIQFTNKVQKTSRSSSNTNKVKNLPVF